MKIIVDANIVFSAILNTNSKISFLSGIHIPEFYWIKAEQLVLDIDSKDTPYVAFSMFFKSKIWSGDKVLSNGLILKGFKKVITTEELFVLRESRRKN